MSYMADMNREQRHLAEGGRRLTARISGEAYNKLQDLAVFHRISAREVIERLLLDGCVGDHGEDEQQRLRMSNDEYKDFCATRDQSAGLAES